MHCILYITIYMLFYGDTINIFFLNTNIINMWDSEIIDLYDPFDGIDTPDTTDKPIITTTAIITDKILCDKTNKSTTTLINIPIIHDITNNAFHKLMSTNRPIHKHNTQSNQSHMTKKHKSTHKQLEQLYLDAGQQTIGCKLCVTCGMMYSNGEINDELIHQQQCKQYKYGITYNTYKNEHLVHTYSIHDRCIMIDSQHITNNQSLQNKLIDIITLVNGELGGTAGSNQLQSNQLIYLYISKNKVVGVCIVQRLNAVQQLIDVYHMNVTIHTNKQTTATISDKFNDAILGIDKIWVHQQHRRHRIAHKLIDCARETIEYGCIVPIHQIAFSQPTTDGQKLAINYTQSNIILTYT